MTYHNPPDVRRQVVDDVQRTVLRARWVRDDGEYARQDRRFQHRVARGIEPGPWVCIERDLIDESQVPSGAQRRDLGEAYAAAMDTPELRRVLSCALAREVSLEDLSAVATVLEHHGEGSVCTVVVEGARSWPAVLGGDAIPGEIERVFTVHVRRAPWRDRAVRRLARLQVAAVEIHPDPVGSDL